MPVAGAAVRSTESGLHTAAAGPTAEVSFLVPFHVGCDTGRPSASPLVPFRVGCNIGS